MRIKLTVPAVEKLKPPEAGQLDIYDELLPGFGLRISARGVRSWFVMQRVSRRMRRITLGRYPALGLAEARAEARRVMADMQLGIDPRRRKAEEAVAQEVARASFAAVVGKYMGSRDYLALKASTQSEIRRVLTGPHFAALHPLPLASISKADVRASLDAISQRGVSPALSSRYLRAFLSWCVDHDLLEVSPASAIKRIAPPPSRDRVLNLDELRIVARAIREDASVIGAVFELLLLTGQRRGEVAGMRWDELRDLDGLDPVWEIPGGRTKNARPHLVWLAPLVLERLKRTPRTSDTYVFSVTGETPVSGFSKAKRHLDARIAAISAAKGVAVASWRIHDLRRSFVTHLNEQLSVAPHVVEAIVNHVSGAAKTGVAGTYNRAQYARERRAALHSWAEFVHNLEK